MWPFNKQQETRVQVLQRDICKLRLSEWRGDKGLVASAGSVLVDPRLRMMLDVLMNECPAAYSLAVGTPLESRALYQAKTEGYMMAISNLEAMGKLSAVQDTIEPTFEVEEKE